MIDHRITLEKLVQQFSPQNLTTFLRAASGSFRPQGEDYSRYLDNANFVKGLFKLGSIDFADGRRLIALAGQVEQELTSQSGRQKQYEIARKVLKNELYDAGIFVFHDAAGYFRFSLITAHYKGTQREFSGFRRYTYFISPDLPAHTFVNQIGKADFASIESILEAFSVEPVTKEFYKEYEKIFREAEASIKLDWNDEQKRLYTQKFFNRLMFLTFLERKGWMTFNGRRDYLRALFEDYQHNDPDKRCAANFHRKRLNTLFFRGLNNPDGQNKLADPQYIIFRKMIGNVPYLNGGLFEEEADDIDGPPFPDIIVARILTDLVYHFNSTVTESTPLDIEVAVDPEMLGKIFEELVTGRHESGSYYTPKPVVAFMCREALKGYLQTSLPAEKEGALAQFVDENNPASLRNPEAALAALRAVKVCDPACGSGAYLLGMMHELLEQRECLFAVRALDKQLIYDRKLEIIQNNLYGVDKDVFAVNIARLRLWLSLIVDYEGDNPPPLPNLDFKIESGDSLTAPDPSGGLQPDMFRYGQVQEFLRLKNEFMSIHAGQAKKKELAAQIKDLRAKIKEWAHPANQTLKVSETFRVSEDSFDWQVDFAEVFAPELAESTLSGKMAGIVNTAGGQMELTAVPKEGGFDIVLANPPYVNMVEMDSSDSFYRERLRDLYISASGGFDIFVPFMERGVQLLKKEGTLAYITPNKLLGAEYAKALRKYYFEQTELLSLTDLSSISLFNASVYPCITIAAKKTVKNKKAINVYLTEGQLDELTFKHIQSSPAEIITIGLTQDTYGQLVI